MNSARLLSQFFDSLHEPRIESEKRVKCLYHVPRGERHLPEIPRRIWHRFAIKGGIKPQSLMIANITQNNILLRKLRERSE